MDIYKQKSKSLIMCTTPLQMLIASKIIDLFPDQEFDFILLALNQNDKYSKYYKILSEKCRKSVNFPIEGAKGLLLFLKYRFRLKSEGIYSSYDNYYVASIDSRLFQYNLTNKKENSKVYTFDDGSANIIKTSLYYNDYIPTGLKKYILNFLGISFFSKQIKESSLGHFTIYPDMPNIVEPLIYVPLVDYENLNDTSESILNTTPVIKLFLGQPWHDYIEEMDSNYINKVLDSLRITHYYPHPREKYVISNVEVIKTDFIFEEYISNILNEKRTKIEVYTFTSSAAINILGIKSVEVKFVFDSNINLKYGFYDDQISTLLNLKIIDWKNI